MRIAVCDDQQIFVDFITNKIKQRLDKKLFKYEIATFTDGLNLLSSHRYINNYDIIFLDVEMPSFSGEEAAAELNKDDNKPLIIFTTSHSGFAKYGYMYKAFRFLDKTDIDKEIENILKDSIKEISKRITETVIKIEDSIVPLNNVIYIEGKGGYIYVHLNNGGVISTRSTLKSFESSQKLFDFVEPKESIRVNYNYIESFEGENLKLSNKVIIKVPRLRKEKVRQQIFDIGAIRND